MRIENLFNLFIVEKPLKDHIFGAKRNLYKNRYSASRQLGGLKFVSYFNEQNQYFVSITLLNMKTKGLSQMIQIHIQNIYLTSYM